MLAEDELGPTEPKEGTAGHIAPSGLSNQGEDGVLP